jgi:hypothetical protein
MSEYAIKPLDASTWDAFARLAEKHNGMGFGGCWCTWFHSRVGRPEGDKRPPLEGASRSRGRRSRRPRLRRRRRGGVVSVRLYGRASEHPSPEGLRVEPHGGAARLPPHVHLRRQGLSTERRRRRGASRCPRSDREGRRRRRRGLSAGHAGQEDLGQVSHNTTRSLYEQTGFTYLRPKGKNHCVMRRTVSPVKAS